MSDETRSRQQLNAPFPGLFGANAKRSRQVEKAGIAIPYKYRLATFFLADRSASVYLDCNLEATGYGILAAPCRVKGYISSVCSLNEVHPTLHAALAAAAAFTFGASK